LEDYVAAPRKNVSESFDVVSDCRQPKKV